MPIYYQGKKIKELYFGGKKIKEAWYGGSKVYSSGPVHSSEPEEWVSGKYYRVGDLVTGRSVYATADLTFQCIMAHMSDSDNEPYHGILESVFWKMV